MVHGLAVAAVFFIGLGAWGVTEIATKDDVDSNRERIDLVAMKNDFIGQIQLQQARDNETRARTQAEYTRGLEKERHLRDAEYWKRQAERIEQVNKAKVK